MSVMDAARNVAEDYPGGALALAPRIDKNPTTLSHQLNETGTAVLGLVTAVKISKRAKDLRILNAFASEMGCMVLPLPEALGIEGDEAMLLVSSLVAEFNDVVQSFTKSVSRTGEGGQDVTANELADIRRQWAELEVIGQRVVHHAEALHEASKPGTVTQLHTAAR